MNDPEQEANHSDWGKKYVQELNRLIQRGLPPGLAARMAWRELVISRWPASWGNKLEFLIYGDFSAPKVDMEFTALRIKVYAKHKAKTGIQARTVLEADAVVKERSEAQLIDAAQRINILLGSWLLKTCGDGSFGWNSWLFHETKGVIEVEFVDQGTVEQIQNEIQKMDDKVRRKLEAALRWIRQAQHLLVEFPKEDVFADFASYWNAFACLVEAVCEKEPAAKLRKAQKQARIDEYVARMKSKLTVKDVGELHRIVDPGFQRKAEHALQVCFPQEHPRYEEECFGREGRNSLYSIRNAVDHGSIDGSDADEIARVRSRLDLLKVIVHNLFGVLIPSAKPDDKWTASMLEMSLHPQGEQAKGFTPVQESGDE